ncbi:hypothetical protein ACFL1B_04470 [Nanoarchaeota archaeon]
MLTDRELKRRLKRIEKGTKYLEEFDRLGGVFPDKRIPATFTITALTLDKLKDMENKSEFVERAIVRELASHKA